MDNKILNLEHEIASHISKDNGATVHFEYEFDSQSYHDISAYTINSNTKELFLLKSVNAKTKEKGLEKILEYIKEQNGMNSFTVIWTKIGSKQTEKSYFYCHDIIDLVNKFFNKKNSADYIIYEIKLNPMS